MTIREFDIQVALGTLTDEIKIKLVQDKRVSKKILATLSEDDVVEYYVNDPFHELTIDELREKLIEEGILTNG